MNIKPIHNNVVIKPMAKSDQTASGIVLPSSDNERPERGEIVAIGDGKLLDNGTFSPMSVSVGDTVVFKKYSTEELEVDGEKYLILNESDIIAILN